MNILVDLDGTIFKTYEVLGRLYKKQFNKDVDWSIISDKNKPIWKTKYGKFLIKCFQDSRIYANLTIYKDADKVLQVFAKKRGNQIIYCTARRKEIWGATYQAFKKYNLPDKNIFFLNRDNIPRDKTKIAKAFDIDIAIDDEEVNIKQLKKVCNYILFDRNNNSFWEKIKDIIL